ncbi:hypothetical protein [Spirillospora sp. NPDC047279]|uniref:hypothetical protein n=1 Tax=Spirillospora sp. NPDC047279 TaxID=3155478 RepID=UPI0033CC1C41
MPSSKKMTFHSMPVSEEKKRLLRVGDVQEQHQRRAAERHPGPVDPLRRDERVGRHEDRDRGERHDFLPG